MIQFNLDPAESGSATAPFSVSVIGIGGSGTNVVDKIALEGMSGADLVSMNCDARALHSSMAGTKIQLGKSLTQGLGCGGDPELGAEAAIASQPEIRGMLTGRNMVFLCVGLGGGTGSGAAPVIARMAREAGAFVVVFATLPFAFEGRRRSNQAGVALKDLRKYANALVTFENDRMGELVVPKKGVQEAFELADRIIGQSVRAVTSLVSQPGLISIGMDDLITALKNNDSRCLFGFGQAKGENRAVEALGSALKSPLLDRGQMQSGARNVLVHICGGTTLTLFEIETLMRELGKHVHDDAQILFGAATDPKLNEHLSVTILTSLNKIAPIVENPETAAPEVAPQLMEAPLPAAADSAAVVMEAAPAVAAAIVEVPPSPAGPVANERPASVPAVVAAQVHAVVDEELFPEVLAITPVSAPVVVPEPEPMLIEIPAVVPPAPVMLEAAAPDVEEVYETEFEPAFESAHEELQPTMEAEAEAAEWMEEEDEEVMLEAAALAPVVETVPERVIRIERQPAPALRYAIPAPREEPRRPIPVATPPAPAKRFALSEIVKSKPKAPAPAPATSMEEYEAGEEFDAPPAVPSRPAQAPVSRRAPDYDRVTPIRPIPAGRGTTPASPFTATRPAAAAPASAPAPLRPVPTQQQTFDERLQPATAGSRFDRAKPTVEEGEDLDVPTFLRRKR